MIDVMWFLEHFLGNFKDVLVALNETVDFHMI